MEVNSLKIYKVFFSGGDVQYILPHFQREYAWDKTQWQTLLNDAFAIYEVFTDDDNPPEHFMGALVVIRDGMRNATIPVYKLVDGQQRLTTISLLLCALGELVEANDPALYKKIRKQITNIDEDGELYFKLLPTPKNNDRNVYMDILSGRQPQKSADSNIGVAFDYLKKTLDNQIKGNNIDPERLFLVLTNSMQVVFIDLDRQERPYEIFESLNAKGKPLSQPDLIRNYIAMRLPERLQEQVFQEYWMRIEDLLKESRTISRTGELSAFMRHYLAYKTNTLYNKSHIYARFRDRMEKYFSDKEPFIEEIRELTLFAEYYNLLLRPTDEQDEAIRYSIIRLNTLNAFTAYPFLLGAFEHYHSGSISREEFLQGLAIIENYLVRRYLAGEQTNYLNKMFPVLWREVDPQNFTKSLSNAILTKNYPSDNRIASVLKTSQLYDSRNTKRLVFVLDEINQYLSHGTDGHTVLNSDPTIEHIMPQSLSSEWKEHLGQNWSETFNDYLHSIGNLTMVTQEWNSALSNAIFEKKREKLARHALALNNQYFVDIFQWNMNAIVARTEFLTTQILELWKPLGEIPTELEKHKRPTTITILGETIEIKSWSDAAHQMAEFMVQITDNFDAIASEMTSYFGHNEFHRYRKLSNGWYLNVNLSSQSVLSFCEKIANIVELEDESWEITTD